MPITGQFRISNWTEAVQQQISEDSKLSTAHVEQTYDGDICGNSDVYYQLFYLSPEEARFTGYEIIHGEVTGSTASIILHHDGTFEHGLASSTFTVAACSIDSLIGRRGHFQAKAGGVADYHLETSA